MTEFSKNELLRLVDKIPETDPTSTAYHVLMQSIECFNALALTVDEIIALRDGEVHYDLVEQQEIVKQQAEKIKEITQNNVVPFTAPAAPWEEKVPESEEGFSPEVEETKQEEKTYTASDVRKALVEVKAKGVDVKEVLSEFGVADFRALPAAKYGQLMARLEAM